MIIAIDRTLVQAWGSAELPLFHLLSTATVVRVVQLLSLAEAKQEACEVLATVVLCFGEVIRADGSELVDWRLIPNGDRFDLLLEIGGRNRQG